MPGPCVQTVHVAFVSEELHSRKKASADQGDRKRGMDDAMQRASTQVTAGHERQKGDWEHSSALTMNRQALECVMRSCLGD